VIFVVADLDPEPAGLDPLALVILHLDRRVVGLNHFRQDHASEHLSDDRLEQGGGSRHPVAQRRPRQLDAEPLEDPSLAVKRLMVGVLADGHVGHESRARQAFLDRLGESLCDHDMGLTGLARILGPHMPEDDQ
jgi:hypothetical protein